MNDTVLHTESLTKKFGELTAISQLNLSLTTGEIFGFLGPNGSGKTTTIRTILGYLRPTSGTATILGLDSQRDSVAIRRHLGYVPAEYGLYEKLTGAQILRYFANLRGGVEQSRIDNLAERFHADLDKRSRELSSGNKQKIVLIQALMSYPKLLILDEPSTGLDPLMQQELQQVLMSFEKQEAQSSCRAIRYLRYNALPTESAYYATANW